MEELCPFSLCTAVAVYGNGRNTTAASCDIPCVTRERRSLTAHTGSPAVDRLSACPVADQLCRRLQVVADRQLDKSAASVPMYVVTAMPLVTERVYC